MLELQFLKSFLEKTKAKNFFLLSWKKLWVIVVAGFASIILHNLVSGLMGIEEVFFFAIVVFIIPAYILIAALFTAINFVKKRKVV